MPLPWPHSPKEGCLHPQHQVLVTHSTAVPTVSYLPLCLRSVPEDRSTLHQAGLPLVPALAPTSQYPIPSTPKGYVTLSPTPKTRLECQDCSEKEFWDGGCLLQRCPQHPGQGHCGQGDLCSQTCHLWASSSPPHSPRSPQVSCGASAGRSLSG